MSFGCHGTPVTPYPAEREKEDAAVPKAGSPQGTELLPLRGIRRASWVAATDRKKMPSGLSQLGSLMVTDNAP